MKRRFFLWLLAVVPLGCGSGNSSNGAGRRLTQVEAVGPGTDCPSGGLRIVSGLDTNGDGALQASEVESSQLLCNGTNGGAAGPSTGHASLQSVSEQSGCATITSGIDDGAGGGIPDDGVLQAGEVRDTETICNGTNGTTGKGGATGLVAVSDAAGSQQCPQGGARIDSGFDTNGDGRLEASEITNTTWACDGARNDPVQPYAEPPGPVGTNVFDISGGSSTNGSGGNGGNVFMAVPPTGSGGGHGLVFRTGAPDVSDAVFPSSFSTYLGNTPLDVTNDLDVPSLPDDSTATDGEVHTHPGDTHLYIYDATAGADSTVTGIQVEAGATLTFEANQGNAVHISVANDIDNAGTITTGDSQGYNGNGDGLYGSYYECTTAPGNCNASPSFTRVDPQVSFDWGDGGPGFADGRVDDFYIDWTGSLVVPLDGTYTFETCSDDGSRLYLRGNRIVNNWGIHGRKCVSSGPVVLTAGQSVSIEMQMYEHAGGAVAQLYWRTPVDGNWGAIPQSQLVSGQATTAAPTLQTIGKLDMSLDCGSLYNEAGGVLSLRGADVGSSIASSVSLGAIGGSLALTAGGSVFNAGLVDVSGGAADAGGHSGFVTVNSSGWFDTSGKVLAQGGQGAAGAGGRGGNIAITTQDGHLWNTGLLSGSGGSGAQGGGDGGTLNIGTHAGDIANLGTLDTSGGDLDAGCSTCGAGAGNSMTLNAYGGRVVSTGTLRTSGGQGNDGNGGSGGQINVFTRVGNGPGGAAVPAGNIELGGAVVSHGGDGAADAGDGGGMSLQLIAGWLLSGTQELLNGHEIILYSYPTLLLAGGDGTTGGGHGGIFAEAFGSLSASPAPQPSGGFVNYATIDAHGGASAVGRGGDGGSFVMWAEPTSGFLTSGEVALNYGDLDLQGGDGTAGNGIAGGAGGSVLLQGYSRAENDGRIDASGGSAVNGYGASAGAAAFSSGITGRRDIEISAINGPAINTGAIVANGGDAMGPYGRGASGAQVQITGLWAINSADLMVAGGNADALTGSGGIGGSVQIIGTGGTPRNDAASINVVGGTGATPGPHGEVTVGGQDVTDSFFTP